MTLCGRPADCLRTVRGHTLDQHQWPRALHRNGGLASDPGRSTHHVPSNHHHPRRRSPHPLRHHRGPRPLAVEVWERARVTRGRRSCSSSPSARPRGRPAGHAQALPSRAFAVVRRPTESALERLEEALDATLSHGPSPRDSGLDRVGGRTGPSSARSPGPRRTCASHSTRREVTYCSEPWSMISARETRRPRQ